MLPDTLVTIEETIREKTLLDDSSISRIVPLFYNYKVGMWVYPGVLKRKANITINESYLILHALEEKKLVESWYELHCSCCQKSTGTAVKTFSEIPTTFECEICHSTITGIENAIMIYKVISE